MRSQTLAPKAETLPQKAQDPLRSLRLNPKPPWGLVGGLGLSLGLRFLSRFEGRRLSLALGLRVSGVGV